MPLLKQEYSGFLIDSTNPALDCSQFQDFNDQNYIRNSYSCSSVTKIRTTNSTGTEPTSNPKKHLSKGATAGVSVAAAFGGAALLTALLHFGRRWLNSKRFEIRPTSEDPSSAMSQLPSGGHHEMTEVSGTSKLEEFPLGKHHEITELPAI